MYPLLLSSIPKTPMSRCFKIFTFGYNSSTCNLWLRLSIISVPITLLRLNTVIILVTFMHPIVVAEPIQVMYSNVMSMYSNVF